MKKIMFMANSLYGGGAEKVLQTLLNNLDYQKYDVTLYSLHREELDLTKYPPQIHYKVVFDRYQGDSALKKFFGVFFQKVKGKLFNICQPSIFYRLYIHEKYDVEIAFIEGESTKIISGSPNKKSKKLAWVHIDLINNPWTSFLYKDVQDESEHYQKFDKILCVSDSVKEAFLKKYRIGKEKVATQYNPIDRNEIIKKAKEQCHVPEKSKIRMIAVGRLVAQKGFDRLVKIALRLKQKGFDFELYILGEGEMQAELKRYVTEHNLEKVVYLLGFQQNPYAYMAKSDFMVCSSRSEGFSTVVSEAVVLGLPVVSTNCAGVKELFGNSKCGIITENNSEALYDGIFQILQNPSLLDNYRKNAQSRGKLFSLIGTMKKLEVLIDE